MQDVFIVGYKRTPVGAFLGALSGLSATDLGSIAVKAALEDANVSAEHVQELYFGNVISANLGQAPARQVARGAGLPSTIPVSIINKVCASGAKAIMLGSQTIRLGDADVIVAGGMESMSNIPHYVTHHRTGFKYGNQELLDGIVRDGLQDIYEKVMMGEAGERTADKFGFSREEQDEYAIQSYKRAEAAADKLKTEITPVTLKTRKGEVVVDADEEPQRVRYDKIPKLRTAFRKEGTITAANASKLNDGAAALVLVSEKFLKEHNLKPIARVASWADAAREPMEFTIAPADALPKAVEKAGISKDQLDTVEINEAFSVVAMANTKILELDPAKVNPIGGAVSLGHPLGCSGARIAGSALTQLRHEGGKYGALGICNGGGGASAIVFENLVDA